MNTRESKSLSLVGGIHAVRAALTGAGVEQLRYDRQRRDRRLGDLLRLAAEHGVACEPVPREALDRELPGVNHQGVVARCRGSAVAGDERALDRLLDDLPRPPLLLVLDGVTDPHNLGACLRTAEAAGVDAVIAPRDRAAGLNATARKVAAGAAERLPFVQVTNLARTLAGLAERGIWLVGLAGEAPGMLHDAALDGAVALVLGSEDRGLRRLTRERCDLLVHIPMAPTAESLNVSVAAGVSLYEAVRQRRAAP